MVSALIVMAGLILLGILFSFGKGSFLIAGFNTMPKEERDKYDKTALTKFMGKMMFALAFIQVFMLLSELLKIGWIFYFGLALFFIVIFFILYYVNTGNRFKKTK